MISIQKTGFWIFGETRVKTDDGKTHTFARDVDVKVSERGVCVTERGLVSSQTTCFIDAPKSQPDGTIAGNAKSVAVATRNGGTSTYESPGISPTRVEKRGSEIVVIEQGVRGARVVATHAAANVTAVTGSTCSVCESLNPLYDRNDTARPQKGWHTNSPAKHEEKETIMSKADRVTIHDGRGNAISLDKPPSGGEVRVDFQGHIVCLKSVDYYGIVREQVCVPISQPPQSAATSGNGSGGSSTGGCGCP